LFFELGAVRTGSIYVVLSYHGHYSIICMIVEESCYETLDYCNYVTYRDLI
jgi:hypothetical protein